MMEEDSIKYVRLDGSLDTMYINDDRVLHIDDKDPDIGIVIETSYVTYVKRRDNNTWWVHRGGGLPAVIAKRTNWIAFFEEGRSLKIQDIDIDDLDKMVLALKHGNTEFDETSYLYYRYHCEYNDYEGVI